MAKSAERLKGLILEFGIASDSRIAQQLLAYLALLEKWNPAINLTSTTEWPGIGPLFQEAIWASTFYPDDNGSHLDIGSGAGFPAVPLKILKAQIRLEMVESRMKKGVFLETLASALGIDGIRVHNMRLDKFLQSCDRDKFWDCITWKAIKLGTDDLRALREHAHPLTQFWMFHSKEQAVEEPKEFERTFKLMRRESFLGKKLWFLSIYLLR